jgi:hypothetical protein
MQGKIARWVLNWVPPEYVWTYIALWLYKPVQSRRIRWQSGSSDMVGTPRLSCALFQYNVIRSRAMSLRHGVSSF